MGSSLHGFIPVKKLFRSHHLQGTKRATEILHEVMKANEVEQHKGPLGIRTWYRTSQAKPVMAEVIARLKAESKRPDQIGVAHPRGGRKRRNAKANGAAGEAQLTAPTTKQILIAVPHGRNQTLLWTLEEARRVYDWLGKVFG